VVGIVIARLLPAATLEAPLPVMVHWPLAREAPVPRVMGPSQAEPASFWRRKVLAARLNSIQQAWAPEREELIRT